MAYSRVNPANECYPPIAFSSAMKRSPASQGIGHVEIVCQLPMINGNQVISHQVTKTQN